MFDRSCVYPFSLDGDGFLYAMIDVRLVTEASQGLSGAQLAALNAFRWTPTAPQLASGRIPVWAKGDPAPIYFRGTDAQIKNALSKRYVAPVQGDPPETFDSVVTT
jgi:hypothetical protein